ncbi:polyketide cyclase [Mycobacterium colombiense]|uniref:nuclear transport factor 2 family protein n=1 Tax=Mycobacterium colombiense TaxID=339268 RepID=UPI0007EFE0F2|nr:nuclear transport factor 2 family protein [Mycobacterium colombiense]OBK63238.1 polyketide cyclase [Mycobacterium colombiense]
MTPPVIQQWPTVMEGGHPDRIDGLLADDAVLYSPAVYTPQRGKAVCGSYLRAAETMFADTNFRYVAQWYGDTSAVLEFVAEVDDIHIDGVDLIEWNADNKITSFKVMMRPLKALQTVIPRMGGLLAHTNLDAVYH